MKIGYLYLLLISLVFITCARPVEDKSNCIGVTITKSGTICSQWGILYNEKTYPSANIPIKYQQEGTYVCAKFELYEDPRACACCGGTWANILSMRKLVP